MPASELLAYGGPFIASSPNLNRCSGGKGKGQEAGTDGTGGEWGPAQAAQWNPGSSEPSGPHVHIISQYNLLCLPAAAIFLRLAFSDTLPSCSHIYIFSVLTRSHIYRLSNGETTQVLTFLHDSEREVFFFPSLSLSLLCALLYRSAICHETMRLKMRASPQSLMKSWLQRAKECSLASSVQLRKRKGTRIAIVPDGFRKATTNLKVDGLLPHLVTHTTAAVIHCTA